MKRKTGTVELKVTSNDTSFKLIISHKTFKSIKSGKRYELRGENGHVWQFNKPLNALRILKGETVCYYGNLHGPDVNFMADLT